MTVRRLPGWLIVSSLVMVCFARASAQPRPANPRYDRLEQWLEALVEHVPGSMDATLTTFGRWTVSEWQLLADDAQALVLLSRDPKSTRFWVPRAGSSQWHFISYSKNDHAYMRRLSCIVSGDPYGPACEYPLGDPSENLRELQRRVDGAVQRGDHNYVLHLAALLHTDLAQWGGTRDASPSSSGGQLGGVFLNVTDGLGSDLRQYGIQWVIAYWLLDRVTTPGVIEDPLAIPGGPALVGSQPSARGLPGHDLRDTWVRDWYIAIASWMQQKGHSDESHLARGLQFFPGDPDLRFLSGCLHEIDASPELQSAMKSVTLPAGSLSVQSRTSELRAAESDFAQALGARPGWTEARIRRGRVLLELGEFSEAEQELRASLASADDDRMRYYAFLFLGAIQERSGRFPEARALYERAAALFPTAQSPVLALSQLLRRQGSRQEAVRTLYALFERDFSRGGVEARVDPWWVYLTIQARDAGERLQALREPFLREGRR